jgi:hypothetical protein
MRNPQRKIQGWTVETGSRASTAIVRPVPVSRYAYHPVRRSWEKWSGSEEKKKRKSGGRVIGEAAGGRGMGGAELKEKWGGSEEKPSN